MNRCERRLVLPFLAVIVLVSAGCRPIERPDPVSVDLFDEVTVHFTPNDPEKYDSPFASARDNGRVMTTYRELPAAGGPRTAVLHLEVEPIRKDIRNVVDRWDRAGWVRLVKPGMAPVELCRFMTAYGGEIEHTVDISHVAPLLTGHCVTQHGASSIILLLAANPRRSASFTTPTTRARQRPRPAKRCCKKRRSRSWPRSQRRSRLIITIMALDIWRSERRRK